MNWAVTMTIFNVAVGYFVTMGVFAILVNVADSDLVGKILAFFDEDGE